MYARVMTTQNAPVPDGDDILDNPILRQSRPINRLSALADKHSEILLVLSTDYQDRNSRGARVFRYAQDLVLAYLFGQELAELAQKVTS